MITPAEVFSFFKTIAISYKFQLSCVFSLGISYFIKADALLTVFLFSLCIAIISTIEIAIRYFKERKEKKFKSWENKLGLLGEHYYTHISSEIWPDKNHNGLSWEILINGDRGAYLRNSICAKCKTNLITKNNKKVDGFVLECSDCDLKIDIGDIGEARNLANSSLQGDVRRNPNRYIT